MLLADALRAIPDYPSVIQTTRPFRKLDFTAANANLPGLDLTDTAQFSHYVFDQLLEQGRYVGVGGYNEHRVIYRRSAHFGDEAGEGRCIHLGVDLWAAAGTPVYAPLAGLVESVAFNDHFGDYGPTLILRHQLENHPFFTLYGHLSLASLTHVAEGQWVEAGTRLATIGNYPENGHWPPHLHFQIIKDMEHYRGDYPGVCALSDRARFLANCPDPNLILRIAELDE